MEYIKNITTSVLDLLPLGVRLEAGEYRNAAEFASRSKLQDYAEYLNDLVYTDKIILLSADLVEFSKVESVQYFSNAYMKAVVIPSPTGKYYCLKDKFRISKNDKVYKTFKGSVDSMYLTPNNDRLDVRIVTGDGIELPVDNLVKRQTLEFEFNGKVQDMQLELASDGGTVEVELFIEGSSTDTAENIQRFINTWYDDMNMWKVYDEPIEISKKINYWRWNNIVSYDGNTVKLDVDKYYRTNGEFELYKVSEQEYIVEYIEWNNWAAWNPNEFKLQVKNIDGVQFNDGLIVLDNAILWKDRKEDGRHY